MTDCQAHQQQLEQQEQEDSIWERARLMAKNHGKMIGCAQILRGDTDELSRFTKD